MRPQTSRETIASLIPWVLALTLLCLAARSWPQSDIRWVGSILEGQGILDGQRPLWEWTDGPAGHSIGPGWLASVIVAAINGVAGFRGVLVLAGLLCMTQAALLIRLCLREGGGTTAAYLVAAAAMPFMYASWLPGNDLYLPIFLYVFISAAWQYDRKHSWYALGWLAAGALLSALSTGALLMILLIAGIWALRKLQGKKGLAMETFLFAIGTLVMPSGLREAWQMAWATPWGMSLLLGGVVAASAATPLALWLAAITGGSWIGKGRTSSMANGLVAAAAASALMNPTNLACSVVLATPFLIQRANGGKTEIGGTGRRGMAGMAALGAAAFIWVSTRSSIDPGVFPVRAAHFQATSGFTGRVFTDPVAGSLIEIERKGSAYLADDRLARLSPAEGKSPIAGVIQGHPLALEWLDSERVERVVASRSSGVARLLGTTPGWRAIFCDEAGAVFERGGQGISCPPITGKYWVWLPDGPLQGR